MRSPLGLKLSALQRGQGSAEQVLGSLQWYDDSHSTVLACERMVPELATVVGGFSETPSPKNRVYLDSLTLGDTKGLCALALTGFRLSGRGRFSEAGVSDSASLLLRHV